MNVLLLCDRKSTGGDAGINRAAQGLLESLGHTVNAVILNREEIKPCLGCFGCWLKTPGKCIITEDAANHIASLEINAQAIVLLSEITYSGFSSDIKAFLDRSIQNLLPFFEIYKGEMHHPARYKRFPTWIAVGYGSVSETEKRTFTQLADRNALNLRPASYAAFAVKSIDELSGLKESIKKVLEAGA